MRTPSQRAAASALCPLLLFALGCTASERPDQQSALRFTEGLYLSVLSGDQEACTRFTAAGREDFVADMAPAESCREAVEILGDAVGEGHLEEFTARHQFTAEETGEDHVQVRADFGNYADIMTVEWTGTGWLAGPTTRVASTQPSLPSPDDHGHGTDDQGMTTGDPHAHDDEPVTSDSHGHAH